MQPHLFEKTKPASGHQSLDFTKTFYCLLALDSATAYSPVSVSSVQVPQYGVHGEHAVLYCKYSSVQPVYSVRWYKNGKEFFR